MLVIGHLNNAKEKEIMRLFLAAVFMASMVSVAIYHPLKTGPESAAPQTPDPCSLTLYPTGCQSFDNQNLTCGNEECGNGFYGSAVPTGSGTKAADLRTTACQGGLNCPSVCSPTAVDSYSTCSTPTPTPTPTPAPCAKPTYYTRVNGVCVCTNGNSPSDCESDQLWYANIC